MFPKTLSISNDSAHDNHTQLLPSTTGLYVRVPRDQQWILKSIAKPSLVKNNIIKFTATCHDASIRHDMVSLAVESLCSATPVGRPGHLSVRSPSDPKITINFKKTHICEITPAAKSYSGYVNLPASAAEGRAYDIHTFF
ncbi:carboxypeptidase D [Apiospora marii]|uniref:carboxypeptidase D n=1 Tax=Apiospora marii TaxID=335849 RepID=UPI00312F0430